ncbi:hypothetical protein ACVWXO_002839 [Bradyrhizobium sp. LM2.7]
MSTIMRRRRGSRLQLGPYKRHELLMGRIEYPVLGYDGYGNGRDTDLTKFISADMRRDWQANRDELMEFWQSGKSEVEVFPDDMVPLASHAGPSRQVAVGRAAFGLGPCRSRSPTTNFVSWMDCVLPLRL